MSRWPERIGKSPKPRYKHTLQKRIVQPGEYYLNNIGNITYHDLTCFVPTFSEYWVLEKVIPSKSTSKHVSVEDLIKDSIQDMNRVRFKLKGV